MKTYNTTSSTQYNPHHAPRTTPSSPAIPSISCSLPPRRSCRGLLPSRCGADFHACSPRGNPRSQGTVLPTPEMAAHPLSRHWTRSTPAHLRWPPAHGSDGHDDDDGAVRGPPPSRDGGSPGWGWKGFSFLRGKPALAEIDSLQDASSTACAARRSLHHLSAGGAQRSATQGPV